MVGLLQIFDIVIAANLSLLGHKACAGDGCEACKVTPATSRLLALLGARGRMWK